MPFAIPSNGDGLLCRDRTLANGVLERELALVGFPSPEDLWNRPYAWKGWSPAAWHVADSAWFPRKTPCCYQIAAVNRTVEALRGLCADFRQHLQQARTTQSNPADALGAGAAT